MIKELINQLEQLVGSDDFEFDMEEIMERIEAEGAGIENSRRFTTYHGNASA